MVELDSRWWLLRGWRASASAYLSAAVRGNNVPYFAVALFFFVLFFLLFVYISEYCHSCRHCRRRHSRAAPLVRQSGASLAILMRAGQLRSYLYHFPRYFFFFKSAHCLYGNVGNYSHRLYVVKTILLSTLHIKLLFLSFYVYFFILYFRLFQALLRPTSSSSTLLFSISMIFFYEQKFYI